MKVFVTGGTGFIGSAIIKALVKKEDEVIALYRDPSTVDRPESNQVSWIRGSLDDQKGLAAAMKGCDAVIHLAAIARSWLPDKSLFKRINVLGTKRILEAALEAEVKKVILTSTAGIIGPSNGSPVTEGSSRIVDFFSEYERSKFEAEQIGDSYTERGLQVISLLPTRLYGPGLFSQGNSVTILVREYMAGKWHILPGNGKKLGNYVFIDDVVQAHLLTLENDVPAGRYLVGGEDISYREFFATIRRISGKGSWLMPIPGKCLVGITHLMFAASRLLGRSPVITPGWARKYTYDWMVSSQKAQKAFNYSITSFEKGMEATIQWLNRRDNEE